MKNIRDIRKANLLQLAQERGSIAEINQALGLKRNHAYLYQVSKDSTKSCGSTLCRKIEKALSLSDCWMDQDHTQTQHTESPTLSQASPNSDYVKIRTHPESSQSPKNFVLLDSQDFSSNFSDHTASDFLAVIVHSSENAPTLIAGDRLLIDTTDKNPSNGFFVLRIENRLIIRRISTDILGGLSIGIDSIPAQKIPFSEFNGEIVGRACYLIHSQKI